MKYRIFCDLDGVLADFDRGIVELTGKKPLDPNSNRDDAEMWQAVEKAPNFYGDLYPMPDMYNLWAYIRPYNPIILTGLPRMEAAERQKRGWCKEWLGEDVQVITCKSREKILEAQKVVEVGETPLIIDDMTKFKDLWEVGGGVFLVHTSVEDTIKQLQERGL